MSYTPPAGDAADVSWLGAPLYTSPAGDVADASFLDNAGTASVAVEVLVAPSGVASLAIHLVAAPMGGASVPFGVLVAPMGEVVLPVEVGVYGVGSAELPVSLIVAPMGDAAVPLSLLVAPMGEAALSLVVDVCPAGSASVAIITHTGPLGEATVGIEAGVVPLAILLGMETVSAGMWTAVVRVDGSDITGRVIGEIVVDAEEGAARIAEFVVKPVAGTPIYLPEWTAKPVTIDVAGIGAGGAPRHAMRLFTGKVDLPALDLEARVIRLRCTDDLQGRCLALSAEAIAAACGGYYSAAVFDAAADGWTQAQDRMRTQPASLDISPAGALRVTAWMAKETADLAFDADTVGDGSVTVQMADMASLVNRIEVGFGYRFPRVKAECRPVDYSYVSLENFAQFVIEQRWFLQRAAVESAISSAGGTVESMSFTPLPDETIEVETGGYWTPGPADDQLCMGFAAAVSFDYGQTVEERHRIVVENSASIAAIGLRAQSMSGALEGRYPEMPTVEAGITLYKKDIVAVPPADQAIPELGKTTAVDVVLTEDSNRAAANAAMETLIAIAKARIWQSHRGNDVSVVVPLNPVVDLDKTISVDASGVVAKGKVRRLRHRMSPDTGEATTDLSIAVCAAAGIGIVHDETPTAAPAGTLPGAVDVDGAVSVTYNSGATQDHQITIVFPEVAAAERDNAVTVIASSYAAPLVEDIFTVTL